MRGLNHYLRAVMAWGMIPMAVWSGLPGTSCRCADGRLKLFCAGPVSVAKASAGRDTCCQANQTTKVVSDCCASGADSNARNCAWSTAVVGGKCRGSCGHMERTSATLVEESSVARSFGDFEFVQPNLTASMFSPAKLIVAARVEHGETGPPVDLVVVLDCFLI